MIWLRSMLLFLVQIIAAPVICIIMIVCLPFGFPVLYRLVKLWTCIAIWSARVICGIDYQVIGSEHIPTTPTIVLAKHQSSWETFFFLQLFPPQVWLLKRELLRIPFFGWGLAMLRPIAIDRADKLSALRQLVQQGKDRLAKGLWIIIFPEGTRTRPGEVLPYARGGALLATKTNTPVLPIALNSGKFWPRDSFLRRAGTIVVSIGKPIDPRGFKPEELNQHVQGWIESEMRRLATL
jgi:1-acyl-sn-glycerol-3-phosphate acyltransferase